MGKRGPKPKSAILESLQGFPGRRKSATKAKLAAVEKAHEGQSRQSDSPNVPRNSTPSPAPNAEPIAPRELPAILTTKREKAIWQEITECPVRSGWFKTADLPLIARHVSKLARLECMMKRRIPATYVARTGAGERIVRTNPEYRAMMQLDREVRAEEQLLAGNPVARLTLEGKSVGGGQPVPPLAPPGDDAAAPPPKAQPDGRSVAIGFLKTNKVPPSAAH